MKMLKIRSSNMRDALAEARRQLGDDVAVLHTRQFEESGMLGLVKHRGVEILAAVDEPMTDRPSVPAAETAQVGRLESQVTEIRQALGEVMSGLAVARTREISPVVERLARNGVPESLAEGIMTGIMPDDALSVLASRIRCTGEILCEKRQARVALIGPTGVGKTTTAAKIAAQYTLVHKKKVALISLDTYRVGAVEQLATYARILNIPLEVAMSVEDCDALVAKHADKDLIVIDTMGRSQRNKAHLDELAAYVKATRPTETHLVLAASADSTARKEAANSFGRLGVDRIIMTKLDECPKPGCVLDTAVTTLLPYSYVTNGQDVPDDIAVADSGRLAGFVWEGTL
jgi:flagellar biosynthesis protein FlhF